MIDLKAHYTVTRYPGVAWYLRGFASDWTEESWTLDCTEDHEHVETCYLYNEPEQIEDPDMVEAIMVGDDTVHIIDVEDLTLLPEDGYCHGCGSTVCEHERYA